jgi:hypothetical protein
MADTITVLDGLLYDKANDSIVWTFNGTGSANECVKSYVIEVPRSIAYARVIFNNGYTATQSRVHVRVRATKVTAIATTLDSVTKTENTLPLTWTALASLGITMSADIDLSTAFDCCLHIDCAVSEVTTVHGGTEVIVQVRKQAVDDWSVLTSFVTPSGTSFHAHMIDNVVNNHAGDTVLGVTDPATGNLDDVGKHIFIEDAADVTHSEIHYLVSQTGN